MGLATNILRRGAVYYFRCAVPAALAGRLGCRELWRSLRTKDPEEARRRGARALTAAHQMFDKLATMINLTAADIAALKREFFNMELESDAGERATGTPIPPALHHQRSQARQVAEAMIRDHLARGDFSLVTDYAATYLELEGGTVDKTAPAFLSLCQALLQAKLEATQHTIRRDQGDWVVSPRDPGLKPPARHEPAPPPPLISPTPNRVRKSARCLRELAKAWIEEKRRGGNRDPEIDTSIKWFIDFLGEDREPSSITRADVQAYRDALLTLPQFWESRCKGMTIREAAVHGTEHPELGRLALSSAKGKRLEPAKRFIEWMGDREVIDPPLDVSKVKIVVPRGERKRKKRDPFSPEQLSAIFNAPIYQEAIATGLPLREARLWVPLVALYSGGRRGEICQLRVSDLITRQGVQCFSINEQPDPTEEPELAELVKQLKNEESVRIVPVHPMLKRLGFQAYLEQRRASGGALLFPVCPNAKRPDDAFGKWFHRLIVDIEVKTKRNCFHSFRHNFESAMLATVKDFTVRCALGGRTDDTSAFVYHDGDVPASRLYEEIATVVYPDLKLDHLCPKPVLVASR